MALLASYYLPGLYVEDHAIDVPLDWRGTSPALLATGEDAAPSRLSAESAALEPHPAFAEKTIRLFYRTLCLPQNKGRDLPVIVYLQEAPAALAPVFSLRRPTAGSRRRLGTSWLCCPTSAARAAPTR